MPTRVMLTSPIFGLRREIDRLFEDTFGGQGGGQGGSLAGTMSGQAQSLVPPVDVREDDAGLTLEFEMPGIRPDDVHITAESGVLTVRAEKRDERSRRENERHHIVERSYGTFLRSIQLPPGVDEERIEADFDHGILRVQVPKAERPQARRIQVRSGRQPSAREVGSGSGGAGQASASGQAAAGRGAARGSGAGTSSSAGASGAMAATGAGAQSPPNGESSASGRGEGGRR